MGRSSSARTPRLLHLPGLLYLPSPRGGAGGPSETLERHATLTHATRYVFSRSGSSRLLTFCPPHSCPLRLLPLFLRTPPLAHSLRHWLTASATPLPKQAAALSGALSSLLWTAQGVYLSANGQAYARLSGDDVSE